MGKPIRVLMVEDSEKDTLLALHRLMGGGFDPVYERVETTEDMDAALRNQAWDMILCDYSMPRFSGMAALELLKQTGLDIPFIMVTGAIGEETAIDMMRAGTQDYIMKSNLSRLVPAVARELEAAESRRMRKQAEEKVTRQAQEWQNTFDTIRSAIWILDRDHRVLHSNRAAEQIFKRPAGEFIGRHCWEIAHGTALPIPGCPILRMQKSLQREAMDLQVGEQWLEVIVDPILSIEGRHTGTIHTVNDITERKQAEEALRESEARFRHLLQSVPNVAVQGYGTDGTTRYWNEASEHLYGYTSQEVLGRNLIDLIIPTEMRGEVEQAIQQMAETGQPIPASEVSLMRKDGSRVSVFSSHATVQIPGQTPELYCIDIDITDLKQAEADLRIKNQVFEDSIASQSIADKNGVITHVNTAFRRMWGYVTKEQAIGNILGSFFADPDDAKPVLEVLAAHDAWQGEFRAKRVDGTNFLSRGFATSLRNAQGELVGYQSTNLDITNEREAEKALQRHVEELRVRNDALTRFNAVTVDRELRMIELKREVNELCLKLGESHRHKIVAFPQASDTLPEDRK
jgi:PAS domain S-box-containing protein